MQDLNLKEDYLYNQSKCLKNNSNKQNTNKSKILSNALVKKQINLSEINSNLSKLNNYCNYNNTNKNLEYYRLNYIKNITNNNKKTFIKNIEFSNNKNIKESIYLDSIIKLYNISKINIDTVIDSSNCTTIIKNKII